jgi:hypothetical protein
VNGRALHFYLAGINNQNFLMRDKETGSWWQQITGKAIFGPLKGAQLELILSDELSFGEWRSEFLSGEVLAPVAKYAKEYDSNWEPEILKLPVVISFPGTELKSRDVIVGLTVGDVARAYPWETFVKQSPIVDHVNGTPLLLIIGPDAKSFRVFVSRIDGRESEFFLQTNEDSSSSEAKDAKSPDSKNEWTLLDTDANSQWNFQGCAVSGPALGKCLDRVPALKDYWFDWRNYHPHTSIYKR